MKSLLLIGSLVFTFQVYAGLPHCDDEAKKGALEAHQKAYQICEDTGCSVNSLKYKGRKKVRVKKDDGTYLKVTAIKKYQIFVTDEVAGTNWLMEVDAANECKVIRTVDLGYFY